MTDNENTEIPPPVYVISDNPEKEKALFGFDAYAKTIGGLIANKENKTPLVIGIFGKWGSGKTTLMETVRKLLKNGTFTDRTLYRRCKTVWFQAWKYNQENEILAALIEEIFKAMENDGFFTQCRSKIEKLASGLNHSKIIDRITKLGSGVGVSDLFTGLEYKAKLGFYDTFQEFFDKVLWTYLNWRPQLHQAEKTDERQSALVIFIDDLDRCPRERIVKVLETIKLFMDKEGCIFIIGAANEIIEEALADSYKKDAGKFMEKIVQVEFKLPGIPVEDFKTFVNHVYPQAKAEVFEYLDLILPALNSNPRRLKRFLNDLNLLEGLLLNNEVDIEFKHILFWKIIENVYPFLKKDLEQKPDNLDVLRQQIKKFGDGDNKQKMLEAAPQHLKKFLEIDALVNILKQFDCKIETLSQLITLSATVETPEEREVKEARKKEMEKSAMTDFQSMAAVPAGKFIFGDKKQEETIENPFEIDIYPVTNAQYAEFIKADGYNNDDYWSDDGNEWRKKNKITLPEYWNDEKWNLPGHPVVGVSYYEAEAYSKWAGKRLPSEKEWERAARGEDGREYPWGNKFDQAKCNTDESGIGKTTRVTRYPNGVSLVGCYDMAGNVWEWTANQVLRGGSWNSDRDNARCADRYSLNPNYRYNNVGLRCVRTKN
ncbi:SUMF1/EgtB/PvdO family nonheme iron enzyme [Desulfococcaceae bacterium HSG9]|nr:SUMF1/EgtB/PvdO family nonheme iron enzyme [Desulfococcaceae bacterium HSG9]